MGGTGYFAAMGGTAVPFGHVGDASDAQAGVHLSARFDFGVAFDRLRGQIEIAYDRFGVQAPDEGRPTLIPVIFTLGLPLVRRSGIRPYLAAGAGAYYYRDGRTNDNQFGVSGGAGLLHRFLLAEIRYHAVPGRGDRYLTVAVGVRT